MQRLPFGERRAVLREHRARIRVGQQRARDQSDVAHQGARRRRAEAGQLLGRHDQALERQASRSGHAADTGRVPASVRRPAGRRWRRYAAGATGVNSTASGTPPLADFLSAA